MWFLTIWYPLTGLFPDSQHPFYVANDQDIAVQKQLHQLQAVVVTAFFGPLVMFVVSSNVAQNAVSLVCSENTPLAQIQIDVHNGPRRFSSGLSLSLILPNLD